MKLIVKILGILIALGVLGAGAAFYFTGDLVESADSFFTKVKSGDYEEAYSETSQAFKSSVSYDDFMAFMGKSSLVQYKEASWGSRSINNSIGRLDGTASLNDGSSVPMFIEFTKEDSEWKIYHIEKKAAGVSSDKPNLSDLKAPEKADMIKIVKESTLEFAKSIAAKNMTIFHKHISKLWAKQYSVDKLTQAYGGLFKMKSNWLTLNQKNPTITKEATINEKGILSVEGFYPSHILVLSNFFLSNHETFSHNSRILKFKLALKMLYLKLSAEES